MAMKLGTAVPVPSVPTCPTHQRPLVMFCPVCRGKKGGQVTTDASEAKRAHLERILGLGMASRWGAKRRKSASPRAKPKKTTGP